MGSRAACKTGSAPDGYRACRNGGAVPPNRVAICSGANYEQGLSLPSSFCIRRRVPLIARLDWRGGLFMDSASALLRGGEGQGSGELSEESSSSA